MTDDIIITREVLDGLKRNGAFTTATVAALGLTRETMTKGWTFRIEGQRISRVAYDAAVAGRNVLAGGRHSPAPPPKPEAEHRPGTRYQIRALERRIEALEARMARVLVES